MRVHSILFLTYVSVVNCFNLVPNSRFIIRSTTTRLFSEQPSNNEEPVEKKSYLVPLGNEAKTSAV